MTEKSSTKGILIAVIVIAAIICVFMIVSRPVSNNMQAVITVDGEELIRIDLLTAKDGIFSILDDSGKNIEFEIKDHHIRFRSSDCPDKICVNSGFLGEKDEVACCMPNKTILVIE